MNRLIHRAGRGARAGCLATVPMTLFMAAVRFASPALLPRPFPPGRVTDRVLRKTGLHRGFGPGAFFAAATVLHFAFGAAAGCAYALRGRAEQRPLQSAVLYGPLVWAATYPTALWLSGLYPPPHRQSVARQAAMIAAHVVWGVSLGLLLRPAPTSSSSLELL